MVHLVKHFHNISQTIYFIIDGHGKSVENQATAKYIALPTHSVQRVPEPDPIPGIFFDTRPDPIQF